ncbi:MAG: anti-sigma factor [Acidobacteriota bacterium]|nr:anti-sigma factor [Acidobacteriota bacterium]
MNEELSMEDRAILAVVEELPEAAGAAGAARYADEAAETLRRLYTELFGLLPCELPAEAPPRDLERRILAMVAGDETQEVVADEMAGSPLRLPDARVARRGGGPPEAPRPTSRRGPWLAALAALLVLALGLSAWLALSVYRARQTVAALEEQVEGERSRAEQASQQLAEVKSRLSIVTSPAVAVSPLRPAGVSPLQPGAHGMLFVAADHQHWYLALYGLRPAAGDRCYQLWFVGAAGPVSGGTFRAEKGTMALSSKSMPSGIREIVVTMEDGAGGGAPRGPEVLRAATLTQVL